jgi:hypothetical protein
MSVNAEFLSMAFLLHHTKFEVLSKPTLFTRIPNHIDKINEAVESKNKTSTLFLSGLKALTQNYENKIAEKQEITSTVARNRDKKRNILTKNISILSAEDHVRIQLKETSDVTKAVLTPTGECCMRQLFILRLWLCVYQYQLNKK